MKYSLAMLIFIASHVSAFGQEKLKQSELHTLLPTALQENVRKLREQKVDTIYTYFRYCSGCEIANQTDESQGFLGARIVWKQQGKTYSKQVDCKNTNMVVKETASSALDYFIEHTAAITDRETNTKGKGRKGTVIFLQRGPVHHNGEQFSLILNNIVYTSSLTDYLKENAGISKLKWIKATAKLSELNQKELE